MQRALNLVVAAKPVTVHHDRINDHVKDQSSVWFRNTYVLEFSSDQTQPKSDCDLGLEAVSTPGQDPNLELEFRTESIALSIFSNGGVIYLSSR